MRSWPLTGRDADLAGILDARRDPDSCGVIVTGPAGVGKTRLAREAVDRLARAGAKTAWILATRATAPVPLGAAAHLAPAELGKPGDLAAAILDWAYAEGGRARVVLGVDDTSLLDDGSAALVSHLAADGLAFIVGTGRTPQTPPPEGNQRTATLLALTEAHVDRLIDHELGLEPDGATLDPESRNRLRTKAAGNPLALRELLAAGRATGDLERRFGVWHWNGGLDTPSDVAALIAANLAGLPDPVRAVVELVSWAEPLPLSMLTRLTDTAAVTEASTRGLITLERRGSRRRLRLAHPLHGESVRALMTASRIADIWRDLAVAALASPLRRHDDNLRVAMWQVDGGYVTRPDVVLRGAEDAADRGDLVLADRLAGAVLRGGDAAAG
ncbi:AAA family ATPase [Phytomonospora sp. NPDC050363]|uniref:ATP-binding protein n=1 Tax=Phytomonospora sp. NPDC050363 TaxID=3155642 RepID=UPI0033DF4B99